MEVKVYVLQKDLPMAPKGTEIKPLSALAYGVRLENGCHLEWVNDYVEKNPEWFKLKEDKIEVSAFYFKAEKDWWGRKDCEYTLATRQRIPEDKYSSIKKAIEDVLNKSDVQKKPHPHEQNYIDMIFQRNVQNPYSKESQSHCAYEKGFEECWNHFFKGKTFTSKDTEPVRTAFQTEEQKHNDLINQLERFHKIRIVQQEEKAFNAGRLTHPMVGFKYDTFNDYKNKK